LLALIKAGENTVMRVGLYLHNYTPVSGGAYTFQREIFRAISELSPQSAHQFPLLAHPYDGAFNQRDSFDHIQLIPIEQPSTHSEVSDTHQKGWLQFKKKQPVSIPPDYHSLSAFDYTARKHRIEFVWFLTPAYELTDIPYIATVWDLQHRLQPWFPEVGNLVEWNGRESYISVFLRRAAYIIIPNEAGRKELHLFYQIPEDRIICLPHPTPQLLSVTADDEQKILIKYGLVPGFLFYPAQYWPHKNHANLLYSLRILKETYDLALPTVFVGSDKGNIDYLKSLVVELGVESQVYFLGFITDAEMTALYKNALALVYLSFFGPENLPPLEAFSVGCPVIAANVNGAIEQLGDAAVLVSPTDADEIALAIKSLMDDPRQRELLVVRGFERAKKTTSIDYVGQVFALLDKFEPIRRAWGSRFS
jgi:glycosyltransferase involved in cell wall biosynthesis